jgi:hypothetical protein
MSATRRTDIGWPILIAFMAIVGIGTCADYQARSRLSKLEARVSVAETGNARVRGYATEVMREIADMRKASEHAPEIKGPTMPTVGDTVVVFDEVANGAFLAKQEAWDRFQEACNEEDEKKSDRIMDALEKSGDVILEGNGTKLEIVQDRAWTFKVRVVSGQHVGWEGLIPRKLVRKT